MSLVTALAVQIIRHKLTVKDVVVNEEHEGARWDQKSDIFYVRSIEELTETASYVNKYRKININF